MACTARGVGTRVRSRFGQLHLGVPMLVAVLVPLGLAACGSDHTAAPTTTTRPTSVPSTSARPSSDTAAPRTTRASTAATSAPRTTVKRSVGTSTPRTTARATATTVGSKGAPTTVSKSTTTLDGGGDSGPAAGTTAPGGPPCDLSAIVQQTETSFDGITPGDLHCAEDWAAWSGTPVDAQTTDGFFAVAQWSGTAWQLRNLGTATVCADASVPKRLWPTLACTE